MSRIPFLSDLLARGGHTADLVRGSSLAMALRLIGLALSYAFSFLVARSFGASAVDAFALATTVVTIIGMLSRLGFDRAIVRFVASSVSAGKRDVANQQYWLALAILSVLGVGLSFVMFAAADVLAAKVFQKPDLNSVFRLASPAVLFLSVSLVNAEALRGLIKNIICAIFIYRKLGFVSIYVPWLARNHAD